MAPYLSGIERKAEGLGTRGLDSWNFVFITRYAVVRLMPTGATGPTSGSTPKRVSKQVFILSGMSVHGALASRTQAVV